MSLISTKSRFRHRSREIALQLIYQLDVRPDAELAEVLELYPSEEERADVFSYSRELVTGVCEQADEIAALLRDNIMSWRPERMVTVDKAAISLALYEGIIGKKVPLAVAISEAVELAKAFGTEDSGRFVNGVLGRIARKENESKESEQN